MRKSPDAFRTISEVAAQLDVPNHVLRFWESKFAAIKPMKRGGGRRYYRPEDVELLRGIRWLLYDDGYTIKGVQRIFRENGVRFVKECWQAAKDPPAAAKDIPDVAGEVAEQARQGLAVADGARDVAAEKVEAGGRRAKSDGRAAKLTKKQRELLMSALEELEACRAMLRAVQAGHGANGGGPAECTS